MSAKLGVLGGMGPMATVDFLYKLVERTPARADHEHIPTITCSVPQLPDRIEAIFKGGTSPLPKLIESIETLQAAGAVCIVMPCNTAHYWYEQFAPAAKVPFLHIADAAMAAIGSGGSDGLRLGLMGTRGTLKAGFYQQRFASKQIDCLVTTAGDQEQFVDPAIKAIKANELDRATPMIERAVESLLDQGATTVVLACTEIPVVMKQLRPELRKRCVDVTTALADASIAWWQSYRAGQAAA